MSAAVPSYARLMRFTSQSAMEQGIKVLVYGRAGVGKTRLIATAPTPVILSAENGTLSLRQHNIARLPEIRTIEDFKEQKRWALESRESLDFYTICLDSISEIAQTVLFNEMTRSKDGRAAYGAMNNEVTQIVNSFRSSNRTVYFVSQEEFEKDEQTGIFMSRPSLPGRTLTNDLPYKFDEVLQLALYPNGQGGTFGALLCHPTPTTVAKDRSGALAQYEQPDLSAIFRKILGV